MVVGITFSFDDRFNLFFIREIEIPDFMSSFDSFCMKQLTNQILPFLLRDVRVLHRRSKENRFSTAGISFHSNCSRPVREHCQNFGISNRFQSISRIQADLFFCDVPVVWIVGEWKQDFIGFYSFCTEEQFPEASSGTSIWCVRKDVWIKADQSSAILYKIYKLLLIFREFNICFRNKYDFPLF